MSEFKKDLIANADEKGMVYECLLRIQGINQRLDRHGLELHEGIKSLRTKLDETQESYHKDKEEILDKIREVEINSIKDSSATKVKLASLSGVISIITSIIVSFMTSKIKLTP